MKPKTLYKTQQNHIHLWLQVIWISIHDTKYNINTKSPQIQITIQFEIQIQIIQFMSLHLILYRIIFRKIHRYLIAPLSLWKKEENTFLLFFLLFNTCSNTLKYNHSTPRHPPPPPPPLPKKTLKFIHFSIYSFFMFRLMTPARAEKRRVDTWRIEQRKKWLMTLTKNETRSI